MKKAIDPIVLFQQFGMKIVWFGVFVAILSIFSMIAIYKTEQKTGVTCNFRAATQSYLLIGCALIVATLVSVFALLLGEKMFLIGG